MTNLNKHNRKTTLIGIFALMIALSMTGCGTLTDFFYEKKTVESVVERVNPQTGQSEEIVEVRTEYVPSGVSETTSKVLDAVPGWGTATGTVLSTLLGIGGLFLNRSKNRYKKALCSTVAGVDKAVSELQTAGIGMEKIDRIKTVLRNKQSESGALELVVGVLNQLRKQ